MRNALVLQDGMPPDLGAAMSEDRLGEYEVEEMPPPPWMLRAKFYRAGPFKVLISDDDDFGDGHRWRHLSVSRNDRVPSYDELLAVRDRFFPADAEVIQVFPPRTEHVNVHPYCLHLWWRKDGRLCPSIMKYAV